MGKRKERPSGLVLYSQSLTTLQLLPDSIAGRAIKAAIAYFTTGAEMAADQTMEYLAFSILKVDIDAALTRFSTKCEQNRRNRHGGDQSPPVVTDGDQNRTEQNLSEQNLSESELKGSEAAQPPHTRARDPDGIICISDEDFEKLQNELGKPELDRVVSYLGRYCMETGKRYASWPAIIRRASREQWGVTSKPSGGSTTPGSFQPTQERIEQHNAWIDSFLEEQRKQQDSKSRWNLEAIEL